MKVFTHYTPLNSLTPIDETRLILCWKRSWAAQGFTPIVINEYHARQHPYYAEFDAAIRKLPSSNPAGYDRQCFLRWLAMAQVGGGIMTDYDCMNYGWKPILKSSKEEIVTVWQGHVPSVVTGSASAYLKMAQAFAASDCNRTHISDMILLEFMPDKYISKNKVMNHGQEGWETAELVHYCNQTMEGKKPRFKFVEQLRKTV